MAAADSWASHTPRWRCSHLHNIEVALRLVLQIGRHEQRSWGFSTWAWRHRKANATCPSHMEAEKLSAHMKKRIIMKKWGWEGQHLTVGCQDTMTLKNRVLLFYSMAGGYSPRVCIMYCTDNKNKRIYRLQTQRCVSEKRNWRLLWFAYYLW